jgi:hypothetical protein
MKRHDLHKRSTKVGLISLNLLILGLRDEMELIITTPDCGVATFSVPFSDGGMRREGVEITAV